MGRRLVPRDRRRRTADDRGRTTRSCSPVPTARSTATARSTRSRYGGEDKHFRAGDQFVTVESKGCGSACSSATTCASPTSSGQLGARHRRATSCPPTGRRRGALHWQALLQARAIENQATWSGVNRVGDGRRSSPTPATAASSTRSARCWRPAPARRDDPVRRHLRRHRRRRPRPVPLPPRPEDVRPAATRSCRGRAATSPNGRGVVHSCEATKASAASGRGVSHHQHSRL